MIEELLIKKLGECLSYPVFAEIPKKYPSNFYVLEKTGSSMENHIKSATVAIQSYATDSKYGAARMNEELKDIMLWEIYNLPEITNLELNSDYDFTDTDSKIYRYQAVFDIKYY